MSKLTKIKARTLRRRNRSKRKINEMPDCPRLVVSRSLKNIQAQIIDDLTGKTLVAVSSSDKSIRADIDKASDKTEQSKIVGAAIAKKAKEKKIKEEPKKKMKDDIVQQLKDLKELYDSGALTKQEYKKAKKKLLD